MEEFKDFERLNSEVLKQLKVLYDLKEHLQMPTLSIQSDFYRLEWSKLASELRRLIDEIQNNNKSVPQGVIGALNEKIINLLARTELSSLEELRKPDPDKNLDKDI